jgi:hypothetical protein
MSVPVHSAKDLWPRSVHAVDLAFVAIYRSHEEGSFGVVVIQNVEEITRVNIGSVVISKSNCVWFGASKDGTVRNLSDAVSGIVGGVIARRTFQSVAAASISVLAVGSYAMCRRVATESCVKASEQRRGRKLRYGDLPLKEQHDPFGQDP